MVFCPLYVLLCNFFFIYSGICSVLKWTGRVEQRKPRRVAKRRCLPSARMLRRARPGSRSERFGPGAPFHAQASLSRTRGNAGYDRNRACLDAPTHAPSGLLPPSAGLRRALPAPAQGPSALENPLRCRAYLATLHPRPLRASPPVGGARRALPAPAQGPSALENPLRCRVQAEVSRTSPNPQRRQAPMPEPAVVAWPLRTIPKRNKAAPPPKRGAGPRRSFAVASGCRHCRHG